MSVTELFLIAMMVIFAVPYAIWRLGRTEYYAPLVVVQIIAGIVLGPGIAGAIAPDYYSLVFRPEVVSALNGIAWWAVMIFVWIAGLELDVKTAWKERAETTIASGLALGAPLLLGAAAATALLATTDGWVGPAGSPWQFVLGVGMASAVTALPILVLFMEKLSILRQPLGQRILRYASLDDIAIWGVMALILLDWERLGRQIGFLAALPLAAWSIRRLMRAVPEPDRWYLAPIWLAAAGFAADWAGLHFMVGAFLSGAVLDAHMFDRAKMDAFRNTILLAIMPVFFLSTGLRTDWEVGGVAVFAAAALLLVASVAGKLAGAHIAGRILKWRAGEAAIIGWLLQTKALIMIIFVSILLDKQIVSSATLTALVLMAAASTMLTIPMTAPRLAKLNAESDTNTQNAPPAL